MIALFIHLRDVPNALEDNKLTKRTGKIKEKSMVNKGFDLPGNANLPSRQRRTNDDVEGDKK
jgi:hypothetical protein